jgi:hypothetical protein
MPWSATNLSSRHSISSLFFNNKLENIFPSLNICYPLIGILKWCSTLKSRGINQCLTSVGILTLTYNCLRARTLNIITWKKALRLFFEKLFSKFFCVCLPLKKLVNEKHFSVEGKFSLVSMKVFPWKIWAENTF